MSKLHFQPPTPGKKIQVIGAGLPRTGTNSFCAALTILLDGPAYHAGVQYATGTTDEKHILTMIEAAERFPYRSPEARNDVLRKLESILDGYVATCDGPLNQLVPELMELYPDALFIGTTRDQETWIRSVVNMAKTSQPKLMAFLFFWIPSLRHMPRLVTAFTNIYHRRYGPGPGLETEAGARRVWDNHYAHLREAVPKDKLVFYSVKDGWEPLCRILGVEVPDVEFPRLNDAKDLEAHFKRLAVQGIVKWLLVVACAAGCLVLVYWVSCQCSA